MPLLINQGTNAAINFDQVGTINTQVVGLGYGTLNTLGTLPNLPGGSIVITQGTLGTLQNLLGGTLNQINNIGTLPNLPGGSIAITNAILGTLGTVQNLLGGTITSILGGTINQINNIGTLPKGTIALGSVGGIDANAAAQTANPVGIGGTDSGGTVRTILVSTTGAMNIGTVSVLPNLPNGSIVVTAGTVASATVVGGTIQILANGTLSSSGTSTGVGTVTNLGSVTNLGQLYNAGTVQNILGGTVQQNVLPTLGVSTYGTIGTTGASVFGTLGGGTGSGSGTEIFITSLSLSVPSTAGSQVVSIGWGTNGGTTHAGTGRLVSGNFPPGGGIAKTFSYPYPNSGTNAQLCYFQAGAGTVNIDVTYFIAPSTL